MAKHTEEEVISYILKNHVDGDGVISFSRDTANWISTYLRTYHSNYQERVAWMREKTGKILLINGFNNDEVFKHRLRVNGLVKLEKVDGRLIERVYSADFNTTKLNSNTSEEKLRIVKLNKLHSTLRDRANVYGLSFEDYIEKILNLSYVGQKSSALKGLKDVDRWIIENMGDDLDANKLRSVEGFVNIRDYLKRNWKIINKKNVSAFVDYINYNFPNYKINGRIDYDNRKEYFYKELTKYYPDGHIRNLSSRHESLYNDIRNYRRGVPGGVEYSMKYFIENHIGHGDLVYYTPYSIKFDSKYNQKFIKDRLLEVFGEGNIENPILIRLANTDIELYQGLSTYCKCMELEKNEFLNQFGYKVKELKSYKSKNIRTDRSSNYEYKNENISSK